MITLYSPSGTSKRLDYIMSHLCNNILGTEFLITSDRSYFLEQTGPSINYSNTALCRGIQIVPSGLLFETGIHSIREWNESEWKGLFCFFYTGKGDIPFDLLAASFYLLSLYEEYLSAEPDAHGRFKHTDSFLFRKGLLETPIIDRWAYLLKEEFAKAGFDLSDFQLRKYRAIHTYDIDFPYLYRHKGLIKNIFGTFRDLANQNMRGVKNRILALFRFRKDPYKAAIEAIDQFQTQLRRPYYLFVLLGEKGKYGRTTLYPTPRYYRYLKSLKRAQIGLHPSYNALNHSKQLVKEKSQLEKILGKPVYLSRRHFLRMQVPQTFRETYAAGFSEDFTLAFSHAPGFRSGTAIPHLFYDLQKEESLALLIRPSIAMDSTFIFHLQSSPEEALQKLKRLADACKQSGGDYLTIWHNSNLAFEGTENPWTTVFIRSTRYAVELEKS
ncbi:MAG: hypothetical protein FWF52_01045 [Candidatus Azobacteroides sp.]|nr:hypothetical protein [Candidatus Azobacteroides sp.]